MTSDNLRVAYALATVDNGDVNTFKIKEQHNVYQVYPEKSATGRYTVVFDQDCFTSAPAVNVTPWTTKGDNWVASATIQELGKDKVVFCIADQEGTPVWAAFSITAVGS